MKRLIPVLALVVAGALGVAILFALRGRGPADVRTAGVEPGVTAPRAAFPPDTPLVRVFGPCPGSC